MGLVLAAYVAAYGACLVLEPAGTDVTNAVGAAGCIPLLAAGALAARDASRRSARHGRLRAAWRLLGAGLAFYLLGDALFTRDEIAGNPTYPAASDAAYLMFYVLVLAGLLHFPRARGSRAQRAQMLMDCASVAITAAVLAWVLVGGPAAFPPHGRALEVLVATAYPVLDVVLIFALSTALLRPTTATSAATLHRLAGALACIVVADLGGVWLSAHSDYDGGDLINVVYAAAMALFVAAARAQPVVRTERAHGPRGAAVRPATLLPWVGVMTILGLLDAGHWDEPLSDRIMIAGASAATVLVAVRQLFASRELVEAHGELERAHADLAAMATTDPLTKLPNHRALVMAIERELASARRVGHPFAIVFLDVDHFKHVNDTLGHEAGDLALRVLGNVAQGCLRGGDVVGRWGGEEFVAILPHTDRSDALALAERLRSAIAGHTFEIGRPTHLTCSLGVAAYPGDGCTRPTLLRAADRAMYAAKRFGRNQTFAADDPTVAAMGSGRTAARDAAHPLVEAAEALALLVSERHSSTGEHVVEVEDVARLIATEMGCEPSDALTIRIGARLHDIGKVAVPDAILTKREPLTDDDWATLRRHPAVGAEVVNRIPALRPIAPLVRSHHERWDGGGYPDGLAGEDIPLGARIIAVADAFAAMASGRVYRAAIGPGAALEELRRCAGTQFDPAVVDAAERALCRATAPARAA